MSCWEGIGVAPILVGQASLRRTERLRRYNSTLVVHQAMDAASCQILAASGPVLNGTSPVQLPSKGFQSVHFGQKNKALDPPTFHSYSSVQSPLSRTPPVTEAETRK